MGDSEMPPWMGRILSWGTHGLGWVPVPQGSPPAQSSLAIPTLEPLHLHSLMGHPKELPPCPWSPRTKNSPSQEPPSPAPQAGTIPQHLEATSAGTWRDLEMWLASVGAHLHPLVASTCYQPGEALEKAKLHLLMRKRLWSYLALFLPLPEGQGPHHALQLYLEGTPLPWWLLSLPGSA